MTANAPLRSSSSTEPAEPVTDLVALQADLELMADALSIPSTRTNQAQSAMMDPGP